ncbi:MAG: hypothetical protein GXO48_06840 [Chlorobi bacterium]|nr:hypothetical protein [Chlorobiota bacterium]
MTLGRIILAVGISILWNFTLNAQVPIPDCVEEGQCTVLVWIGYDLPTPKIDSIADTLIIPALTPFQRNALEFIRGFEVLVDSPSRAVKISWEVIDASASEKVKNQKWQSADIIVPFGNRHFVQSVFKKDSLQEKHIVVNTWNETSCCPHHKGWVQWYPSVRQHVYTLVEQWRNQKVVVIYPSNATYAEKRYVEVLKQIEGIYKDIDFTFLKKDVVHIEDLQKVLVPFDTTVVFIASLRLPLVFNVMEQLSISTVSEEEYGVKIYGLPTWVKFHQLEYRLLKKFKPVVVSPFHIRDSLKYWELYKHYLDRYYENLWGNSFFIAYDLGSFIVKWLEYAKTYWLQSEPFYFKGILTEVALEPFYLDSMSIARWENICVSLLRFEDKDYKCYKNCVCRVPESISSQEFPDSLAVPQRRNKLLHKEMD